MDQNQHGGNQGRSGRRGHFHRGRRGPDRRGQEPRPASSESPAPRTEHVDVEQLMRDIRARIAQRHGIDLSTQQVSELAARRLEAILDPRNIDPSLLEQLRKAAGARPVKDVVSGPPAPPYEFTENSIYETHRGLLGTIRKLLNPVLRLFFNPVPIVQALSAQARLNTETATRDAEHAQRQAEWNALHYELIKRVVTESARSTIELQALTLKVESLTARLDFADRRVRALEAPTQPRHGRGYVESQPHATPSQPGSQDTPAETAVVGAPSEGGSVEGQRRRRRRRRGRRNGPFGESAQASAGAPDSADIDAGSEDVDAADNDGPDEIDIDASASAAAEAPIEAAPDAPAVAAPSDKPPSSGSES